MDIIFQLVIILVATKVAGHLSVLIGQPSVLGKLIAGVLVGPAVFGLVQSSELITAFSQIGILLLIFIAGMETNLDDLKKMIVPSTAVAIGGILFPVIGGYLIGNILDMNKTEALFLGLLLAATSVSITVQTLREIGKIQSKESTAILGAAVLDDILVVILLAFMMSFVGDTSVSITEVILKKVLFFILIALIAWKIIPYFMKFFTKLRVTETIIAAGLIICLTFAYLGESLGVAGMIGAYFAGLVLSQSQWKEKIQQSVEPIAYTFFVPVFFVSVGLSVSFQGLTPYIGMIILFSLLAIFSKWIGSGLGAKLTGFDLRGANRVGIGMISRGEVALIIASIGLQSGLINQIIFTVMIIVVLITTLITPPLLKWSFSK